MSISNSPKNAYYDQLSSFYRPSFFKHDGAEDRIKAKEQVIFLKEIFSLTKFQKETTNICQSIKTKISTTKYNC